MNMLCQKITTLVTTNQTTNSFLAYFCEPFHFMKKITPLDDHQRFPRSRDALQDSIQRFVQRRSVHNLGLTTRGPVGEFG